MAAIALSVHVSDVSAPVCSVRGAAVEPERFVPVKPEVQVGPGQQSHDPRAQRTYAEELRREPITDKYVSNLLLLLYAHTCICAYTCVYKHNHSCFCKSQ